MYAFVNGRSLIPSFPSEDSSDYLKYISCLPDNGPDYSAMTHLSVSMHWKTDVRLSLIDLSFSLLLFITKTVKNKKLPC